MLIEKRLIGLSSECIAVIDAIAAIDGAPRSATVERLLWTASEMKRKSKAMGVSDPKRPSDRRGTWKR